ATGRALGGIATATATAALALVLGLRGAHMTGGGPRCGRRRGTGGLALQPCLRALGGGLRLAGGLLLGETGGFGGAPALLVVDDLAHLVEFGLAAILLGHRLRRRSLNGRRLLGDLLGHALGLSRGAGGRRLAVLEAFLQGARAG